MSDVHFVTRLVDTHSVLESHDEGQYCVCVVEHNPNPMELNRHHILPLGMGGADRADNVVWLCPTAHANVHELLRAIIKYEGFPPWNIQKHFSQYIRSLARDGYDSWLQNNIGSDT